MVSFKQYLNNQSFIVSGSPDNIYDDGRGIWMDNFIKIVNIYEDSFRANVYTWEPYRMIGLIDVGIRFAFGVERVTLAYYRSSGTNSGKIKGLWYPIVGIKEYTGGFGEFTDYLNYVLSKATEDGYADEGWLVKSPFFSGNRQGGKFDGFSYGVHQEKLFAIGKRLRHLYENGRYVTLEKMDAGYINTVLMSDRRLYHNMHTQRKNYEEFIQAIYET